MLKSNFIKYAREHKDIMKLALALGLGLLLIFLGGRGGEADEAELESRVGEICAAVEGVGECRVMIYYGEGERVDSVLVVCEGGDSIEIRKTLTEMLSSLFGIGANRVRIERLGDDFFE